jgi:two-component system, OmpR family, response regulator BaeR
MILIAEDEPKLAAVLQDYLRADGLESVVVSDGALVLNSIRQQQPDLVLLDLMLPNRDGLSICRELRSFSTVPVIMLTARVEEIERLLGLELGADDYICKPFSPHEVAARVRALLRRQAMVKAEVQAQARVEALPSSLPSGVERLVLNDQRVEARFHGVKLDLTPVEYRLLKKLSAHPGLVYSRSQLLDGLYLDHRFVSDRTIDTHIKNLRRKVQQLRPDDELIESVYGLGYRFRDIS